MSGKGVAVSLAIYVIAMSGVMLYVSGKAARADVTNPGLFQIPGYRTVTQNDLDYARDRVDEELLNIDRLETQQAIDKQQVEVILARQQFILDTLFRQGAFERDDVPGGFTPTIIRAASATETEATR